MKISKMLGRLSQRVFNHRGGTMIAPTAATQNQRAPMRYRTHRRRLPRAHCQCGRCPAAAGHLAPPAHASIRISRINSSRWLGRRRKQLRPCNSAWQLSVRGFCFCAPCDAALAVCSLACTGHTVASAPRDRGKACRPHQHNCPLPLYHAAFVCRFCASHRTRHPHYACY